MEEVNTNKKQKSAEKEMTFWDHLEELRWHIVRSFLAVVILAIVAFLNRNIIFDLIILAPKDSDFITNRVLCQVADFLSLPSLCIDNLSLSIINIKMSGQFMIHMYISLVADLSF